MQEQVNAILAELDAGIAGGDATGLVESLVEKLLKLSPVTELDAVHIFIGQLQFFDRLMTLAGPEEVETLSGQRETLVGMIRRLYGSDETPYLQSRSIIRRVALELKENEANADEIVAAAISEIESLQFDERDAAEKSTATVSIHALHAERNWRAIDPSERDLSLRPVAAIANLENVLATRGFDYEAVNETARLIREEGPSPRQTYQIHAAQLMIVLGMGLRAAPDALPALRPTKDIVIAALEKMEQPDTAIPASGFAAQCEALLGELDRGLRESGFSEYLFQQCLGGLRELQLQTDDDGRMLRESLFRMIDISVPFASKDEADALLVMREGLLEQDAPKEELDAAGIKAEAESIIARLKNELAAGKTPASEVSRAVMALQALALRVGNDDDEAGTAFLTLIPEVLKIAGEYAPPELRDTAQDMTAHVSQLMQSAPALIQAEGPEALIQQQDMQRTASRIGHMVTSDPWEQPDAAPYLRQFAALLRPFTHRLSQLRIANHGSRDAAEIERLGRAADVAFQRLRSAATEQQWIDQQRRSLRRVAIELRQFERRHHLMVIDPPWPSPAAPVDANAIFFSGSPALQPLITEAAGRIGMTPASSPGLEHGARNRWDQLRRSAAAIFDFTGYDRSASDPPGPLPRAKKQQQAILAAAAPVARVAYECGWAYVLGVPFITLAESGRPMPFDIDIQPVLIDSHTPAESDHSTKVTEALQSVLFGVQRGSLSEDLSATLSELRVRFGRDNELAGLLDSVSATRDAMQVQFAVAATLDRVGGGRVMMAFPAFPPAYPDRSQKPSLFHVTAFREWSKVCQDVVRQVCSDNIQYRIGYEHLDPNILRSIWNDLCQATFVVADLTCLNPNAVLELGMALALGRPTLIVTQSPDIPAYLPALEKVRIHPYTTGPKGRAELAQLLHRFLE